MPVRVVAGASVNLPVGGVWEMALQVVDYQGVAVDDLPEVTATLPGGGTVAVTVEELGAGLCRGQLVTATPGRHVAEAVTLTEGSAALTCYATLVTSAVNMPDLIDLVGDRETDLGYLGANSFTDEEVEDALAAEAADQRGSCHVPAAYPDDLRQALLRRVAVNLAHRSLPLGVLQGDAEAGTSNLYLPGKDPQVRRYEAKYPRLVVG